MNYNKYVLKKKTVIQAETKEKICNHSNLLERSTPLRLRSSRDRVRLEELAPLGWYGRVAEALAPDAGGHVIVYGLFLAGSALGLATGNGGDDS